VGETVPRRTELIVLKVLLFAQLVYVVNMVHFPWETGIPGVATANIFFLAVLLFMRGKPEVVKAEPMLQKPLLYFFGALTFAFLLGQLRAPKDFMTDLTYLKNALFYPLFYFIYLRCRQDQKTTRYLIIMVMAIAAVAGLEAIREGFDYGFGKYNATRRASGPFGVDWRAANRAGVFFGMFMPMFVALALFLKGQKLWRLAAVGGCALLAGGTLFTYSRQSYFLVLLALAVLLLRKSIIFTVIIGVTLVSLAGYLPDAVTQRVEETKQQDSKSGQEEVDVSTSSRWEIWAGGLQMTLEHPLGVGLNRFKGEIGNYSRYKGKDAHNFYVLTLAECGPQGLITLLMLMWTIWRLTGFVRKHSPPEDPERHALALGFTVSAICMMLGGIYGSPTLEGAVMAPFWALCGLLERYTHLRIQSGGETPPAAEPTLTDRFPLSGIGQKRP
jgi:hypothetical protein